MLRHICYSMMTNARNQDQGLKMRPFSIFRLSSTQILSQASPVATLVEVKFSAELRERYNSCQEASAIGAITPTPMHRRVVDTE